MYTPLNDDELGKALRELRHSLNTNAELSGQEEKTMQILADFMQAHSDFQIVREQGYLYACRRMGAHLPAIAFRADIDGIKGEHGGARHGCGHDGHMTIVAGLAAVFSRQELMDKNIYLLFQPAEETGEGAYQIVQTDFIERHNIKEIYGLHNIPGVEEHKIICKEGTFACTSKGFTVSLVGKPSHAAYPEFGINPVYALAELVSNLQQPIPAARGLVLCTIVHLNVGQKAFGTAASHGELSMTLRAEYEQDLEDLESKIKGITQEYAKQYGLQYSFTCCDEFPVTANDGECVSKVEKACAELGLGYELMQKPMRWSEDFGYFTKRTRGAFFGVGAGLKHPQLHTAEYEFPDALIKTGLRMFCKLAEARLKE